MKKASNVKEQKLQGLQKLFPDIPTSFLENLTEFILMDSSWVNIAFKTNEKEYAERFPDATKGYHATLMTINNIMLGGNCDYLTNATEEPTQIAITCSPDYGS